ncbi:hypothetical protein Q8A67_023167 [Cirrhinus molitorella]|uniref:Uncharacterized protein n=1 Tax=Cirrhinus molitorella TaxID=172907 RepID=A0AA88NZG3_9TELE|nr:hypothetical protein Q8A67_023167 [Cirrhinus molitorella]
MQNQPQKSGLLFSQGCVLIPGLWKQALGRPLCHWRRRPRRCSGVRSIIHREGSTPVSQAAPADVVSDISMAMPGDGFERFRYFRGDLQRRALPQAFPADQMEELKPVSTSSSRCWAGMCSALGGTERRAAGPAVSSPVPEPQLHWSVPEPTGFRMRAGPHGALWPHTRETACVSCHQRTESLKCAAPVCRGRAPNAPSPSVELREAPFLPSCSRFCSKIRPADWPLCLRADEPDGGSWRDGGRANFTQNTQWDLSESGQLHEEEEHHI